MMTIIKIKHLTDWISYNLHLYIHVSFFFAISMKMIPYVDNLEQVDTAKREQQNWIEAGALLDKNLDHFHELI